MAAAIGSRLGCAFVALSKNMKPQRICQTFRVSANETILYQTRPHHRLLHTRTRANSRVKYAIGGACGLTLGVTLAGFIVHRAKQLRPTVLAADEIKKTIRPPPAPRRSVVNADKTGLKLTLYQYESCPFCCKVRAMLDYYGLSYDIVEVDPLSRAQIQWSAYKKVPILVLEGVGEEGYSLLGDSSMSLSVLESYFRDLKQPIETVVSYYPILEEKTKDGKTEFSFPNKYFIMSGGKDVNESDMEKLKHESKWRRWNDDVLMHVITPNLYRTLSEAHSAVEYFAELGCWRDHIDYKQYWLIMTVGPYAMYTLGLMLKSKYKLKPEVRLSLYDVCDKWVHAVGKTDPFHGGDKPNLADLSVYGTLSCMEGCPCFEDMIANTGIGPWYDRMRHVVNKHYGARLIRK